MNFVGTVQSALYYALSLGQGGHGVKLTTHLHLVPRSKNEWNYTSTPQYVFTAWCSVKRSTGTTLPFTFTFFLLRGSAVLEEL
jgi:hypothetical protein